MTSLAASAASSALSYSKCVAEVEEIANTFMPRSISKTCNVCLKRAEPPHTMRSCSRCKFVFYCDAECKLKGWKGGHKKECELLVEKLEKWKKWPAKYPLTDASREGRFRMHALLLFRLLIKRDAGALAAATGKYSGTKFADLSALQNDDEMVEHGDVRLNRQRFHKILDTQLCAGFLYEKEIDDDTTLEYCARIAKNALAHTVTSGEGETTIGMLLYLDCVNACSCRPNAQMLQGDGWRCKDLHRSTSDSRGRPLFDAQRNMAAYLPESSVLLGTKGVRRGVIEYARYSICECERCLDPADDFLSALACEKCRSAIPIDDSSFRRCAHAQFSPIVPLSDSVLKRIQRTLPNDVDACKLLITSGDSLQGKKDLECECFGSELRDLRVVCSTCSTMQPTQRVEIAFAMMTVIEFLTASHRPPKERISALNRFDVECGKVLPECNLYRAKLHRLMADDPNIDPSARAGRLLKWHAMMQKCYPRGHAAFIPPIQKLYAALTASSKVAELRVVIADYLQMIKIWCCAGLLEGKNKQAFEALLKHCGIAPSQMDFSKVVTTLSEQTLFTIAHSIVGSSWE